MTSIVNEAIRPATLSLQDQMLGAHWVGEGVSFALYSAHAERVELCLFDPFGQTEVGRHQLSPQANHVWQTYIQDLAPGALYGYRVYGPYAPESGHRFNHHKLLIDPYAKQLHGSFQWDERHFAYQRKAPEIDLTFDQRDNAAVMPKCVVTAPKTDPQSSNRPEIPWQQTTLYETHLRGFTIQHPDVPELQRGTFTGMSHQSVIDYIKSLGVTSVELLPVQSFIDEHFLHAKGLRNYWGYNTLNYFVTQPSYLARGDVSEVRNMVNAYHDAGLEVVLDVVYNHTCESDELGPTLSFRGIDNQSYYRLDAQNPRYYVNDTGCGNTLDATQPVVQKLVLDSLRYWADDIGVDGFRFDLATSLGRSEHGFDRQSPLLQAITNDPSLAKLKLIAEPWDIGPGGYQLGNFPAAWSEWNDRYRDDIRRYWRADPHSLPSLARSLHGSSEVFEKADYLQTELAKTNRSPQASINFITSHDGFSLWDLVSYENRHNLANGEQNSDGHAENLSQNFGVEGDSDDPEVLAKRQRCCRNMLATLLLSQGVPMLQAGDELGRSQQGNNNAYCQDNELSWLDWSVRENAQIPAFIKHVLAIRRSSQLLQSSEFIHATHTADGDSIQWLDASGGALSDEQWNNPNNHFLAVSIQRHKNDQLQEAVVMVFNNQSHSNNFKLPPNLSSAGLQWGLDTQFSDGKPKSSLQDTNEGFAKPISIAAESVAVFIKTN